MVRRRDDIGVTDPGLDPGPLRHRLLGLKLAMGGMEPLIIVSAYLQAGVGLNEQNMQALSTIAQWQELEQLPVLAGGMRLRTAQRRRPPRLTSSWPRAASQSEWADRSS